MQRRHLELKRKINRAGNAKMEDDLKYRNIGTGVAEKIEDLKRVITGAGNAKKKDDIIKQSGIGDVKEE